jgi:CotS family spore coat protein
MELDYFRRQAITEKDTSAFSRLYLRYFEPFYRQAVQSYERLLNSSYQFIAYEAFQKKTVCHHDFSCRNLLRVSDRQLCLVDFDYAIRDIRIHDLINLVIRNLRHNEWNIEVCNRILYEYHQRSRLSADEIEVMHTLLTWPQDFWQVGLQYYVEQLPWPAKRFLHKLEHRIEARFMREKFLNQFPQNNTVFRWDEAPAPFG